MGAGGKGGAAGRGGQVNVTNRGKFDSGGEDADAIFAQSVGGGGGIGGGAHSGLIAVGGGAGAAGDGR